jgi:DNA invertase Pin-like site-specific DNA recombinase
MPKPAPDPKKAVAYLRASTERQDLSPDAQRDAIAAWATANGVEVVAWHEDLGVSGGTELEKRPGLLAATEVLRTAGAGVLVVAKRDRLARDVLTAALVERLAERAGARVVAADGTGNGDGPEAALLRTMIDAFAAYERALIRSRTRSAMAVKRARGERTGTVPYGFRQGAGGLLVEDEQEQAALRFARRLRAEGESLRGIGKALIDAGHAPRAAQKWHVAVLSRLVG